MMTKKDYIKFAELFHFEAQNPNDVAREESRIIRDKVARIFAADNPHFNEARFIEACRP